jgi:hypothetical protein
MTLTYFKGREDRTFFLYRQIDTKGFLVKFNPYIGNQTNNRCG